MRRGIGLSWVSGLGVRGLQGLFLWMEAMMSQVRNRVHDCIDLEDQNALDQARGLICSLSKIQLSITDKVLWF